MPYCGFLNGMDYTFKVYYLILVSTLLFSKSLQMSSCKTLEDFSVDMRYVQFLSDADDIFVIEMYFALYQSSKQNPSKEYLQKFIKLKIYCYYSKRNQSVN